jgi:hypothetical protein
VSGLRDIEEAIEQPPAGGRAEVRGQAILRHCKESDRYSVEWQQIVDHEQHRVLDLNDPFGRDAVWKSVGQIPRRFGNDQFRRLLASRRQLWPER